MKITEKPFNIPDHWQWVELKELAEINPTFDRTDLSDDDPVSFVPMKRVEELSGRIDLSETEPLTEVRKGYTYFEDGDVIFAKITPCMENGKVAVARGLDNGVGFGSTEFHVIRHPKEATQEWIFHYLIQEGFRRDAKRAMTGSAGQKRLPTGYIEDVPIPLPPLPEQRRIVAKIEELFSNLDAGMADLQAAGQQLERYRLSVLQAAVEGRLTADWRRTHDPEPADQLLERILEKRRKQWEEDYREKYRKKERDLPSGWKSRYSEAEEPETQELEELPKGWTWTSLDQLLSNMRNGYSKAPKADDGVPILRISSVRPLSVNLDDVRYLEGKPDDYEKYLIEPGYLLFIRYNGNPGLVGACGAVPALHQPYAHPDKLIRGEVADHETVMPSYLEIALNMGPSRDHIQNRIRTTAGQAGISQGDLYSCPVPVPPPAEQKQIVDEVERLLSVADDAAATAEREHTRAERLRQSILKQAFSGQLVPHDENAVPPAIELNLSHETNHSSSERPSPASSDQDDVVAEELYDGKADPGKQIEMDL